MKFNHPNAGCPLPHYTFKDLQAGDLFRSKEFADETTYFIKTSVVNTFFNALCLNDGDPIKIGEDYEVELYVAAFDIYEEDFRSREGE